MRWHGSDDPKWASRASEFSIIALACLAPWAFGAVEAWAELAIDLGIGLAAVLALIAGRKVSGRTALRCGPGLALVGLSLLGLFQATPLPIGVLERIAPSAASLHRTAAPVPSERVLGDSGPPVGGPASTISILPEGSLRASARLATAWVLFQCVLGLGGSHRSLRRFGQATAMNAATIALFALIQGLTWDGQIYWFRSSPIRVGSLAGGPFVGHSALAAYLNLGLGLALGELLARPPSGSWWRGKGMWPLFAAGVLCVGLFGSHSRSGVVGAVIATAFLVTIERKSLRRLGARCLLLPGLVLLMLITLSVVSPYQRLVSLLDSDSYRDRLEIWDATLRAFSHHRFIGAGLGSYPYAVAPEVRTDDGVIFARAENEYLDMLLEGGLIGLTIMVAGLFTLARHGYRALAGAKAANDRGLVAGALFGLVALACQSAADFSPHIPGVAITAVILSAQICALSIRASTGVGSPKPSRLSQVARTVEAVAMAGLLFALLPSDLKWARAEADLAGTGLPPPGSSMPEMPPMNLSLEDLEQQRSALEAALRDRPEWAEGHFRLGLTLVALYEQSAAEWIATEMDGPAMIRTIADSLWLHEVAQSARPEEIAEQELVARYLGPATRSFLEARRCAPEFGPVHARLASLDYLLQGRDPTSAYVMRALQYASGDRNTLSLAAQVAIQAGYPDLAAQCWRRCLEARRWDWRTVAEIAAVSLPAEQVIRDVLPPGSSMAVAFADQVYADPRDRDDQAKFYRVALERLPSDATLSQAERLHIEARARCRLGEPGQTAPLYEEALKREPLRGEWREEFVAWLIDHGDFDAAHRHAVLGVRLNPDRPAFRRTLEQAVEALARGGPQP